MQFKEGMGWKACFDEESGRYTAENGGGGDYHLYEITEEMYNQLDNSMTESEASSIIHEGRHLYMDINDRCGPPYTVVFDDDYKKICPWANVVAGGKVWPDELTDAAVEIFESENDISIAKNKSGWNLLEYVDIGEDDISRYQNVTGSYAIIRMKGKFLVGFNKWRKQWEFPASGIDDGETARQAAIRELYEETHQKQTELDFRGLFKVKDEKGIVKYQAVFVGELSELLPFIPDEKDEMKEIYLWDMDEDIGYVDECDKKIAEMVC